MSQPLISIIVPCYNVEAFIKKGLQSIYLQTYTNWECILVDDGSKDNVSGEIDIWVKKDSRYKYIYQDNEGVSSARNKGLDHATGDYILFFDPDDLFSTNALENLISLAKDDIDIIIGKNAITNGQNYDIVEYLVHYSKPLLKVSNQDKNLIKIVVEEPIICVAWNKLYRRDFLKTHNLKFKKGVLHEDELWFFETLFKANAVIFNNEPTYFYNVTNLNSVINNMGLKNLKSYLEIIEYIYEQYYKTETNKTNKELISIYITHLKIKAILHCYKQLNKKDRLEAKPIIEACFGRVTPVRTKKILADSFETLHYHFKLVKLLSPNLILRYLRYYKSSRIMRQIKAKWILKKATKTNNSKNRTIVDVR
ncbi:Beta-1,3-glucosyltransferase [Xanthomarina gelatinilytica]|uniref:Beta-1,3-glucosyltransferase n=1 Tax=Xanthomarina gelatinilytica TaxID=1137281 RepID=M7MYL7_9FLAO|nr:glycosyltransferase [Xanthomarina gelatinilytica]EMQ94589.1 Beta-1,3-glucosyltransferase [Xanthomarina gelatinilytica]